MLHLRRNVANTLTNVVSLFGEELVRRMVDLVDTEQGKRKEINSIVQGAA